MHGNQRRRHGEPYTTEARKGEEIVKDEGKEPGRQDTGTTGAGRPAGKSDGRDSSTVCADGSDRSEEPEDAAG